MVKVAVFPVGGLGTRFLPATKSMPKEMLTVVDKPIIHYAFEEACRAGVERFIFITGRNKNAITNHFDHAYELEHTLDEKRKKALLEAAREWLPEPGNLVFIRQQKPLGLGHAIYCARHFIKDEPFAVLLADEMFLSNGAPILSDMVDAYDQSGGGNVIAVSQVPESDTNKYGIIDSDDFSAQPIRINGMVEKPEPAEAPSNYSIIGRYILEPQIFEKLKEGKIGKGGEIQLTDAMESMLIDTPTYGVEFSGRRFDCGSKLGFLKANIALGLEHPELKDDLKAYIETL